MATSPEGFADLRLRGSWWALWCCIISLSGCLMLLSCVFGAPLPSSTRSEEQRSQKRALPGCHRASARCGQWATSGTLPPFPRCKSDPQLFSAKARNRDACQEKLKRDPLFTSRHWSDGQNIHPSFFPQTPLKSYSPLAQCFQWETVKNTTSISIFWCFFFLFSFWNQKSHRIFTLFSCC